MYRKSLIFLVVAGFLWSAVDLRAEQLSQSRAAYIKDLELFLRKGVDLKDSAQCHLVPAGSRTTLLKELLIQESDGNERIDECFVGLGIPGPVVIPAQTLTYLGCSETSDIQSLIDIPESLDGQEGMFFKLETGQILLVRCKGSFWADSIKQSGLFSRIRIFPRVIGGNLNQSSEVPDDFPFDG